MWFSHLLSLLHRAWQTLVSALGTTTLAVIIAVAVFLVTQLIKLRRQGYTGMKENWKSNLRDGVFITAAVWAALFGGSLVKTIYDDHQNLVNANQKKTGIISDQKQTIEQLEAKLKEQPKVIYREKQGLGGGHGSLSIDCHPASASLPVMPPEGRIFILAPREIPAESGGGGFTESMGPAGSETGLPKGFHAYDQCKITNHGTAAVFNVSFTFPIAFKEAIKGGSGKVTLSRNWPVKILYIDPGPSDAFVFYVVNGTCRFLFVDLPQVATLQVAVESEARNIRFVKREVGYIIALDPVVECSPPTAQKEP